MNAPLLSCRGLGLRAGGRWLLRELDLDVAAGERWALVGPNGAGKTSLLMVLAGARAAEAGTIALAGRPIDAWGVEALAGLRALVADRWFDPFASSVLDLVVAARYRLRGADAASADGSAVSAARACLAAMDCTALAPRDVRYLSRGERQRVAVAVALAQDTALLLLDEPISHQDPRHQIQVLQALRERPGCTCIGALHDVNAAARFASHALLIYGDGRWLAGPAATVLTRANLSPLFETAITEVVVGPHRVFLPQGD